MGVLQRLEHRGYPTFQSKHGGDFGAMNIRDARAEDLAAMVALARGAPTAAHWADSLYAQIFEVNGASRIYLVAEDAMAIRGFLIARVIGNECELENIVVAEGSQRHGVGSALIGALINAVRDREAKSIFLEVRESNVAARALYETCGFSMSGRRDLYYNDPQEHAILYTLAL
jgi:[ribosomal protein S18]-alanine N-acetyltransferase